MVITEDNRINAKIQLDWLHAITIKFVDNYTAFGKITTKDCYSAMPSNIGLTSFNEVS